MDIQSEDEKYNGLESFIWETRMEGISSQSLHAAWQLFEMTSQADPMTLRQQRAASSLVMTQSVFGMCEDVLQSPVPPSTAHYWRLLWHYARGLAWLSPSYQSIEKSMEEYFSLKQEYNLLEEGSSGMYEGFPYFSVVKIARLVLESELAAVCDEQDLEIESLKAAWEIEKSLPSRPVEEPRAWSLPIAHNLGASLVKHRQKADAWTVYNEVLNIFPNDGWALYGKVGLACEATFNLLQDDSFLERLLEDNEDCSDLVFRFNTVWAKADVMLADSAQVLWVAADEQVTIDLEDAPQCDSIRLLLQGQPVSSSQIENAVLVGVSPFPFLFFTGLLFLTIILIKRIQLKTQRRYQQIVHDNNKHLAYANQI